MNANSSKLCLVLLTGISDDNVLEESRRQNALSSTAPHNRYLRNVAQNPSEEEKEEDRGLQNLGLAKVCVPAGRCGGGCGGTYS